MEKCKLNTIQDYLEVQECNWKMIKEIFLKYHYLKTMPAGILACYYLGDKRNFMKKYGGVAFSNGRIQYHNQYLDFSRLWVTDKLGKNTESWFVSRCLKKLEKKFPSFEGAVTWADPQQGHDGTLYLACNFIFDGYSRKVKRYIGKSGKIVYERTATKNLKEVGEDKPKKRFIYYFDSQKRERLKND